MKVFIIGYYGHHNVGDDAMLSGLMKELETREVEAIDVLYNGDSFPSILERLLRADIVALGGGTHLRNWGRGSLKQGLRVIGIGMVSRLLGKRFYMWNVGIDGKGWEWLARRMANFLTIRDKDTADSAVLIEVPPVQKQKVIGINLTPVHDIYYGDRLADCKLMSRIVSEVKSWLEVHPTWQVKFFSFNNHGKYSDEKINLDAACLFPRATFQSYIPAEQILNEIAKCSLFIGMRYHACVFAYMAGVPFVAYNTYPSVEQFARVVGMPVFHNSTVGNLHLYIEEARKREYTMPLEKARELASAGVVL